MPVSRFTFGFQKEAVEKMNHLFFYNQKWISFGIVLMLSGLPQPGIFPSNDSDLGQCTGSINLFKIVECTIHHSPEYRLAQSEWEMSLGGRKIAGYLFPSNPTLGFGSASRQDLDSVSPIGIGIRSGPDLVLSPQERQRRVWNGEILLSQEIYIGGKRENRIEIAETEIRSKWKRILLVERFTAAEAVGASLDLLAAEEEFAISKEIYQVSQEISEIAKARWKTGLGSEMDSELADSESLRAFQSWENSLRKKEAAKARLTVMMGIPYLSEIHPMPPIWRSLPKLNLEEYQARCLSNRPDLQVLALESEIAESKFRLTQREKTPNPIISGYIQNDGFNEQVVGFRLSIPIPIWRDQSGELDQAKSGIKIQKSNQEIGSHQIQSEAIQAWTQFQSWNRTWAQFQPNQIQKLNENLENLRIAILGGKITVRDALVTQKSFLDLKVSYYQTKLGFEKSKLYYIQTLGEDILLYLEQGKPEDQR